MIKIKISLLSKSISGAKYSGVPHIENAFSSVFFFFFKLLPFINILESPKSVSLICPLISMRIFSGFKSLYDLMINLLCLPIDNITLMKIFYCKQNFSSIKCCDGFIELLHFSHMIKKFSSFNIVDN